MVGVSELPEDFFHFHGKSRCHVAVVADTLFAPAITWLSCDSGSTSIASRASFKPKLSRQFNCAGGSFSPVELLLTLLQWQKHIH